MDPDNEKLSDCHNAPTDSRDIDNIKCTICGAVCSWHVPQSAESGAINEQLPTSGTENATQPIVEDSKPNEPDKNPTKSDFKPILQKEFEIYRIWKSTPVMFKVQSDETLISWGLDELQIQLMRIRDQKEFAEKYGVCEDTLTDWNVEIEASENKPPAWAMKMNSNIISALYRGAMKKGDADKIKLWLQYIMGWKPESGITVEDSRETTRMRQELDQILGKISEGEDDSGDSQTTDA